MVSLGIWVFIGQVPSPWGKAYTDCEFYAMQNYYYYDNK